MVKLQSILDEPYEISIPCLRLHQPIGDFFIATIDSKVLCEITYADVRRIYEEREFETYLGIQRPLNRTRVSEITEYVNTVDACFPTAVILAVDGRCAEYDERKNRLVLRSVPASDDGKEEISRIKIAKVLDGQHRIEGLRNFSGEFQVNVSIFVDMDVESQAYIFSTVNLAQTKVNKSLVYDLFELAKSRSPQKTSHRIAVALNNYEGGPFHRRIKRLGSATAGRVNETLTQATFVEALLPYLTGNKVLDRDLYKRGKKPSKPSQEERTKYIFREMFLAERDLDIADVVSNYFEAAAARWPLAWNSTGEGLMLNKTNGFKALMRFLRPAYLALSSEAEIVSLKQFSDLFRRITLNDMDFNIEKFLPGTAGESSLYNRLLEDSGLKNAMQRQLI
jgi:DGQHR domain-containing protein